LALRGRLRFDAGLVIAILLLLASLYFLNNSFTLITEDPPRVAASLMAAVIGLALLSASITLLRTWIMARASYKGYEEREV
jgi:multisubunit Na+/H+ antiporter MnhB subunit